jgi:hypothetical protein
LNDLLFLALEHKCHTLHEDLWAIMVGWHVVGWKCNNLRSHIIGLVQGFVAIEELSMNLMRIQKEWWIMAMWPIVGYKFNNSQSHVVGPILEGFILVEDWIVLTFLTQPMWNFVSNDVIRHAWL